MRYGCTKAIQKSATDHIRSFSGLPTATAIWRLFLLRRLQNDWYLNTCLLENLCVYQQCSTTEFVFDVYLRHICNTNRETDSNLFMNIIYTKIMLFSVY